MLTDNHGLDGTGAPIVPLRIAISRDTIVIFQRAFETNILRRREPRGARDGTGICGSGFTAPRTLTPWQNGMPEHDELLL